MLFKLSVKNMKKSVKDYSIYFLTLVLGVSIFYMFNSIDSQSAMLALTESKREMVKLLVQMINMVSVFVAVILALLIIYANNFLINRRKREFGVYMTLGMGRRQISKIILFETVLVGIASLVVGLFIGVFASQFMSVLTGKLFDADMDEFKFAFSSSACIKTCIYFAVMYLVVMLLNTLTVSRYKLINLLTAVKKNETVKIKNQAVSVIVFIVACIILVWAYCRVTVNVEDTMKSANNFMQPIIAGIIGTVLIFWSLSGFLLKLVQSRKKTYLKGANMFVLRQLNNKINTTVVSMSVICLLLFMTISILSSSLSLRNMMHQQLEEMTPIDVNMYKLVDDEKSNTITNLLKKYGFDMNLLKEIEEIPVYKEETLKLEKFLGDYSQQAKKDFPMLAFEAAEWIVKISDYNRAAVLYNNEKYSLNDDEYMVICDYDSSKLLRNEALKSGKNDLEIAGKTYHSKYNECKSGYIQMSASHMNTGIILVPDSCKLGEKDINRSYLLANYNANNKRDKEKIEKKVFHAEAFDKMSEDGYYVTADTKIDIANAANGLTGIIVFVAIYLGIIFLIASSAILALKQLTESSDNKQRYDILRKIGCDEKMINQALFRQIGIFFALPMILAIIHSIFGIKFAIYIMKTLVPAGQLLPSVIAAVFIITFIYGLYLLATYVGSKNIIK